jgi:hypothetical protein
MIHTSTAVLPADLLQTVESEANTIRHSTSTIDIPSYLERWLPMKYPNKGLPELIAEGRHFEIHHEVFSASDLTFEIRDPHDLESCIQHYGNSHQRDYCYLVRGHRFDLCQHIQFRGVLGLHRISKLILALLLAGCPAEHIHLVDHRPDYLQVARNDLAAIDIPIDIAVVGGLVVTGRQVIRPELSCCYTFSGDIISGKILTDGQHSMLLSTFPYGDLCRTATQALLETCPARLLFTGATGSMTSALQVGDLCMPLAVTGESAIECEMVDQSFLHRDDITLKGSPLHGNIRTPLLETQQVIETLAQVGVTTLETEVYYFHQACREHVTGATQTGIVLYVSDVIGSEKDLGQVNFSDMRMGRKRTISLLAALFEELSRVQGG